MEIFADGACLGNPGPGGYGAIIKRPQGAREISGCEPETTNNRMELTAVIEALRQLERPSNIVVVTDSNYVVQGMTEWLPGWIKRQWRNSRKKPVLNKDLWEILADLSRPHQIEWQWVKGHQGHPENERCDHLAKKAAERCESKSRVAGDVSEC